MTCENKLCEITYAELSCQWIKPVASRGKSHAGEEVLRPQIRVEIAWHYLLNVEYFGCKNQILDKQKFGNDT